MDALSSYIDHTEERDHAMQAARTIFTRRDAILDQIKISGTELDEKYARLAEADILMLFAMLLWETNESIKLYDEYKSDSVPVPHTYDYLNNLLLEEIDGEPVHVILKDRGWQLFDFFTPSAFDIFLWWYEPCTELQSLFEGYREADTLEKQATFLENFRDKGADLDSLTGSLRNSPPFVKERVKQLYSLCSMVLPYTFEELNQKAGRSSPSNSFAQPVFFSFGAGYKG